MKQYLIIILTILLITACAPVVEVEEAQPVEPEVIKEPEETELEEPIIEETVEENLIEIKEDGFYPAEKTIAKNTEIKWVKNDPRTYNIACYLEGARVTMSSDLGEGDSFTYTFIKEGEYTCLTFPYGLRNIITVEAQQALLSPTGSAIRIEGKGVKGASLAAITLIAIVALLIFIYKKKR